MFGQPAWNASSNLNERLMEVIIVDHVCAENDVKRKGAKTLGDVTAPVKFFNVHLGRTLIIMSSGR